MAGSSADEQGDKKLSDAKPQLPEAKELLSPDAQAVRNVGAGELSKIESNRTNASNGSLRRYAGIDLESQNESIEIDFGEQVVSRKNTLREKDVRVSAQKSSAVESTPASNLEAKEQLRPPDASEAKAVPMNFVHSSRSQDLVAQSSPVSERLAESQSIVQSDEPGRTGATVDGKILQGFVRQDVAAFDAGEALTNSPQGWLEVAKRVASLPLDKQAEVIAAGLIAGQRQYQADEKERAWGRLIGTVQGLGVVLENFANITDFGHAVLYGDKVSAAAKGEQFGKAVADTVIGGMSFVKASDQYLGSLGAASYNGDNTKVLRDVVALGQRLDQAWSKLPPREQERIVYKLGTELVADGVLTPSGAAGLYKATKITEILDKVAKDAGAIHRLTSGSSHALTESLSKASGHVQEALRPVVKGVIEHAESLGGLGDGRQLAPAGGAVLGHGHGLGEKLKQAGDRAGELVGELIHRKERYLVEGSDVPHTAGEAAKALGVTSDRFRDMTDAQRLIMKVVKVEQKGYFSEAVGQAMELKDAARLAGRSEVEFLRMSTKDLNDLGFHVIEPVGNRLPINWQWAGKNYPFQKLHKMAFKNLDDRYPEIAEEVARVGVPFSKDGWPNFKPFEVDEVIIQQGFVGRKVDFAKADKLMWPELTTAKAREAERKRLCLTWHHDQDGHTLSLIPTDLHDAVKHTGGIAVIKRLADKLKGRQQ